MRPNPDLPWPICQAAVDLIAESEGCRLKSYRCPAGVWTCGWGETAGVTPSTVWTQAEADQRLLASLHDYAAKVQDMCTVPPSENELGALVSLAYNIGLRDDKKKSGLYYTTVRRQHNAGNSQAAARAFALLNKARVRGVLQPLPGLTARRAAEAALYLRPDDGGPTLRMPQAVQAESSLAKSPIASSGAIAAGTGVVSIIGQAGDQIGTVGTAVKTAKSAVVETLGVPEAAFLPLVLIAAGGVAVYWRWKQRRGGWA